MVGGGAKLEKCMFKSMFVALTASVVCLSTPAFSAGEEPAAAAAPAAAAQSAKALSCKRGEAAKWSGEGDAKKQACVTLAAGVMSDEELYEQGKMLATENEYDWALEVLALITKQDDAKVLNYIGYSHRKAGRLETGIEAYKKALALDPNYSPAREYLGEAYLMAGKKDLAMAELTEIKNRCGETCVEYTELKKAVDAAN
jgi:Flp pilus assembly protein TadD